MLNAKIFRIINVNALQTSTHTHTHIYTLIIKKIYHFLKFSHCLGGGNGIEWKGIKRIILEYFSIPLFESFNVGNEKFISLFRSSSGRE